MEERFKTTPVHYLDACGGSIFSTVQYYYLGQYDKPELGGKVGYLMLSGV